LKFYKNVAFIGYEYIWSVTTNNVFQCGRPVAYDNCRQCGMRIGGQAYVLGEGNRELAGYVCI